MGDDVNEIPAPCEFCGRPMVRRGQPRGPGMARLSGNGRCKTCCAQHHRAAHATREHVARDHRAYQRPNTAWLSEAEATPMCRRPGADPEWWFSDTDPVGAANARRLCLACPLLVPCREDAIGRTDGYGIVAGLNAKQRAQLRAERRREAAA